MLALSPYNLHTYPTWLVVNGVRTYVEQSPFYDILDGIKFVASIEIIKIHGLLAAAALFTFVGATLTNYFTHKILDRIYPKGYRIDDLRVQSGNMNHSENFRKFMRDLAARSESALDENDKQILLQLDQCTLTPEQKKILNTYLQAKIDDETVEVKNPYRLALANLNQPGYFPSLKLTKLIEESWQHLKAMDMLS